MNKNITVSFGKEGRLNENKEFSTNIFIKLNTSFRKKQLKELKGCSLSVFICLALHMNDEGECFVSNDTICKETGYGITSVKNAKKKLVDLGYLHVKEEQWTKELAYKRYPVKFNQNTGEDINKEKRIKVLKNKLGDFTSNTYTLFPILEDKNSRSTKSTPGENSRSTKSDSRQNLHHAKTVPQSRTKNNKTRTNSNNESFKTDDEEEKLSTTKLSKNTKKYYEQIFNKKMSVEIEKELLYIADEELIYCCLKEAEKDNAKKPRYLFVTLLNWSEIGVTSEEEVDQIVKDRFDNKTAKKRNERSENSSNLEELYKKGYR